MHSNCAVCVFLSISSINIVCLFSKFLLHGVPDVSLLHLGYQAQDRTFAVEYIFYKYAVIVTSRLRYVDCAFRYGFP
jgi:hypothetical protein